MHVDASDNKKINIFRAYSDSYFTNDKRQHYLFSIIYCKSAIG